jgi:alginate O-acetyltransferase complex protein AlgI
MSLFFYAWGEPKFVLIMIASIVFNHFIALLIDKRCNKNGKLWTGRPILLFVGIVGNLSILIVFKYLDFIILNLNRLGAEIPLTQIALPIGISFFTFQAMSYIIDVYRGTVPVQKKLHRLGLYISFFPQLIAGPIVRYNTIADQIESRTVSADLFSEGVRRFIIGFSKKMLLANNMALIADNAFGLPDAERSVMYAWIGAVAYSFQILFDFSGYSDMAIGLGKMFGFKYLENFNYPYISKSISEFWRRWHISLGQWFRDYVYFPLGGSRVGTKRRLIFNLFVVWALTGVWHGASWNFVLWGLMYFALIAFEKLTGVPNCFESSFPQFLYRIFTLLCVMFGWVLFRAHGTKAAVGYVLSMAGVRGNAFFDDNVIFALREYWLFLAAAVLCSAGISKRIRERLDRRHMALGKVADKLSVAFYLFCFVWSFSFLIMGSHNPFIYFNF